MFDGLKSQSTRKTSSRGHREGREKGEGGYPRVTRQYLSLIFRQKPRKQCSPSFNILFSAFTTWLSIKGVDNSFAKVFFLSHFPSHFYPIFNFYFLLVNFFVRSVLKQLRGHAIFHFPVLSHVFE